MPVRVVSLAAVVSIVPASASAQPESTEKLAK